MKQLLHNSNDGRHVIVALHDIVFYYNNHHNISGEGGHGQVGIYELESIGKRSNTTLRCLDAHQHGEIGDTNDDTNEDADVKSNLLDSNKTTAPVLMDTEEVQAVAVTTVGSTVWCAVARYDKSLTIYSIEDPTKIDKSFPIDATKIVHPHTIHRTMKRVSSLSFATVYGETSKDMNLTVIVAGDVVGDAIAYSIETNDTTGPENDDDDNDIQEKIITKHRRLLLGHTASMLTSVHIVERSIDSRCKRYDETRPQQFILTSDRDEKIRVSRFPETYCIEGYLLGHTAFVSSLTPIPSLPSTTRSSHCVSVGGDCTIRLWDYSTYNELAVASTNTKSNETVDINVKAVTTVDTNNDVKELDSVETPPDTLGAIPTKVAVTADGSLIATMYDDCLSLDFWLVRSHENDGDENKFAIDRTHRWDCPGQPLGITFIDHEQFVIVMQEPDYLQQYKVIFHEGSSEKSIRDIVSTDSEFCKKIQQSVIERDVIMPDGLLEKDEYGCLKMSKMSERRGGATIKPWNNISRRETNAERIRRLRKRRREEQMQKRHDEQSKSIDPESLPTKDNSTS